MNVLIDRQYWETAEHKQSMQKKHKSADSKTLFFFPANDYLNDHPFAAVSSNRNPTFARLNKSPNPKFPSNHSLIHDLTKTNKNLPASSETRPVREITNLTASHESDNLSPYPKTSPIAIATKSKIQISLKLRMEIQYKSSSR